MTNLFSRRALDADLPICLEDAARARQPFSLIMCDVDHFKRVNDNSGHQTGDRVLTCIAKTIKAVVDGKGRAYRYGGEEMTLLLRNHVLAEALSVAERLRTSVEGEKIEGLLITVSCGVCSYPDQATTPTDLLKGADSALYDAKNRGRNLVRFFNEPAPETPRPPQRKQPPPGAFTQEESDRLRLEYLRSGFIRCPKDQTILEVREQVNLTSSGAPVFLLVMCKYCGVSERI